MKRNLLCTLLLVFVSSNSVAQTTEFFEYQLYSATNTVRVDGSTPEAVCSEIYNQVVSASATTNPDIRYFNRMVQYSQSNLWACSWNTEDIINNPGLILRNGINIGGSCQKRPEERGPRPMPVNIFDSPRGSSEEPACFCELPRFFDVGTQWCTLEQEDKDIGGDCNKPGGNYTPNPCNVATGNKYRAEQDITGTVLDFTRYYNSDSPNRLRRTFGGWSHTYQRRLITLVTNVIYVASATERSERFSKIGGAWVGDAESDYSLTEDDDGYTLTLPNGATNYYSLDGLILSQTDTNGHSTTYEYDTNLHGTFLTSVTNQYGQSISFSYEVVTGGVGSGFGLSVSNRIDKITDANGAEYKYRYDYFNNLTDIIYPDTTPNNDDDNPRKIYHYEDEKHRFHLTGISDENGDRYATFEYDIDGRAITSELGTTTNSVGQEKIELDYQQEAN